MADLSKYLETVSSWENAKPADSSDYPGSVSDSVTIPSGSGMYEYSLDYFPAPENDPSHVSISGMTETAEDPSSASEFRVFYDYGMIRFLKDGSTHNITVSYTGVGRNINAGKLDSISSGIASSIGSSLKAVCKGSPDVEIGDEEIIINSATWYSPTIAEIVSVSDSFSAPANGEFTGTFTFESLVSGDISYLYLVDTSGTLSVSAATCTQTEYQSSSPHKDRVKMPMFLSVDTDQHICLFGPYSGLKFTADYTFSLMGSTSSLSAFFENLGLTRSQMPGTAAVVPTSDINGVIDFGYMDHTFHIPINQEGDTLTTGDGTVPFPIGTLLSGKEIVKVTLVCSTPPGGTATTVMLRRKRNGISADVLSSAVSIAATQTSASSTSINTSYDDLLTGDCLFADVDTVSTTPPEGLSLIVEVR